MVTVPNSFPIRTPTRRLAIISEFPDATDEREGKPLCGSAGQLLDSFLAHAGINRAECFVGHICQHRPPNNLLSKFDWAGEQIQGGIKQLSEDLCRYQPHLCLLLGNGALRAFSGERRTSDWHGYVWKALEVVPGVKCIGAIHPAAILRDMSLQGEEKFYLRRTVEELKTDELVEPVRRVHVLTPTSEFTTVMSELNERVTPTEQQ